ncbi:MAG: hypothetical protein ACI9EF_001181 [Pseudohongiellaceae bacterium]|jgi:hypothetical protein
MARFPGTERQQNRAGFQPGQGVRCRRSRANAARDLSDRRGFVVEVRPAHARVLFGMEGESIWLEGEALLPEADLDNPALERFRQVYALLDGQRLELDDECWTVFGPGFTAPALDHARSILGNELQELQILAHGVSELAARMTLHPAAHPKPDPRLP